MKRTTKKVQEESDFKLTESDRITLLNLARKTLEEKIRYGKYSVPDTSSFSDNLKTYCGAFVSLHIEGKLRGCIGHITGDTSLHETTQEMVVSSAIHDPRFHPVKPDELADIDIELSVLSPLKKISNLAEIQLGKHGILIKKGRNSGLFLPQVATETNWNLDEFLGHCSRDKAGLNWDGWKTADIFIFTADVFGEKKASK